MKKHSKTILIAFAAFLICTVLVVLCFKPATIPMPAYQGRTADQWLNDISTGSSSSAMDAFREMGTNAFPVLLAKLEHKTSTLERLNLWVYPRLPMALRRRWHRPKSQTDLQNEWSAIELVLTNVRDARNALPDLTRICEETNSGGRPYALILVANLAKPEDKDCIPALIHGLDSKEFGMIYQINCSLQRLGPAAKEAVPAVTPLLQSSNLDVRVLAAVTLWKIDGQTTPAQAALKEALYAPGYSYMRGWAPYYLRQIDPHDESLIPYFIKQLESGGDTAKLTAATAIGSYGSAARAAVPALTNLVNSRNQDLRMRVLRSLNKIDPETAAKYEQ